MNSPATTDTSSHASSSPAAHPHTSPILLALAWLTILLIWSFNYVVGKITLRHIDGWSLASMRLPLAALLMLPLYFAQPRRTPLRRRDLATFIALGFFGVVINMGGYTLGLSQTTSEHAVIVMALGPVLVLLLGSALKIEALTAAKAIGMAISFAGILALESEHRASLHSPFLLGDLTTLLAISGFSVFAVLAKRVAMRYEAVSMNTYYVVAGALMVLPLGLWRAIHLQWGSVGWVGWAGMFYMAGGSTVASYTIFSWILRRMDPSRVAAINYVQPVIVILISIPLLGEHPTGHLLAGAALVLFGVYLAERSK
ncbi:MAG TPA: DMT family transporter [Candidatus Acidoferrales bacterium]|nr:DMT family transporter [Candidatus Acidoferrales bacterium]